MRFAYHPYTICHSQSCNRLKFSPLSANPTKWTNCLSVFDHFVRLAIQGLKKIVRNCHSIFKKSLVKKSNCVAANDFQSIHEGKDTLYLFPLKFYGHRWLENTNMICRILEIFPYLKKYFKWLFDK